MPFFIADKFPCSEVCSVWNIAIPALFLIGINIVYFFHLFTVNLFEWVNILINPLKYIYLFELIYLKWVSCR